jgi:hypothetical protein
MPSPKATDRAASLRSARAAVPVETPAPETPRPSGSRAARDAAAAVAAAAVAAAPAPHPAPVPEPEVEANDAAESDDDAFGPEDVLTPPGSTPPPIPVSSATALVDAPVRASSAQRGIALPQHEDLSTRITQDDIVVPLLKLSQAMSETNRNFSRSAGEQGAAQGNWFVSLTNRNLGQHVYFVPVKMYRRRSYFVSGEGLLCKSNDMLQGEGDPGILCDGTREERERLPERERGCELRLWNGKTRPKCGITYNFPGYVILDIEHPEGKNLIQVLLQMRQTHSPRAKQLITMVQTEAEGIWRNAIFELGVEEQTNDLGTWYVPTVAFFDTTDLPEFARLRRQADRVARQLGVVDPPSYATDGTDE